MSARKVLMKLKKNKKGDSGLYLFEEDLLLLKQLLIHQSMRATSIHEFYQTLVYPSNDDRESGQVITNRIIKLQAAGLLVQAKVKIKGSFYLYHYRLGTRAIDVLIELGILQAEERERVLDSTRRFTVPSEHTEAMSRIANRVFLTLQTNRALANFTHVRGSAHKEFGHSNSLRAKDGEVTVVPDWVFTFGDTVVCVEIDTGSQRQKMIEKKYNSYIKYSRRFIKEGKRVIVVFSVVDGTIFNRFSDSRDKRIHTIKQLAPPFSEWMNVIDEVPAVGGKLSDEPLSMQFYAVSAKQTAQLIERLLMGTSPLSPLDRYEYAEDWVRKARHVLVDGYEIEILDKEKVFLPRRERKLDCDSLLSISGKDGNKRKRFAVIYGEEGSIMTYQLIAANAARISTLNEREGPDLLRLLVCYDEESNMVEDVYGKELSCEMWQTDSASWLAAMNKGKDAAPPDMLYVVSQFRKDWRGFHD